jgi:hypothetical protein
VERNAAHLSCGGIKVFLLFFKKEDSSFSEEKEAKRLLFLLLPDQNPRGNRKPLQASARATSLLASFSSEHED